jgi:1,2-diacylglycerol 3-alpha-glucosyltransferase
MRILIAGSTYPPQINGQSVFTGNLAAGMTGRGHDVLVMTPSCSNRPSRTIENGVLRWSVRSLDLNFVHRDLYIAVDYEGMVSEALDTFQPDIVHLQDSAPLNRCLLRHARSRNIPVIITHHIGPAVGAPYFTWFTDLLGGKIEGFVWSWITSFLNKADILTAPSRAAANMLRCHHVTPPVWAISCGVQIEDFQPKQDTDLSNFHGEINCPTFLYVGRLDWEKRPEVILHALSLLPAGSAQLILAGTGAAEKELKVLAQKLQIEEQVLFLGDVQHEHVPALYQLCDIFVMPGDAESLSIATLEAMAAGKPVLAANSMALPELVETGVNGLLFQPRNHQHAAEQMQWFIDHERDWKRMGRASIQRAAPHSIPEVMTQYEILYRDTAAQLQSRKPSRTTQPAFNAIPWVSQRLQPHLKAIFLLVFLFLASSLMYSETIAAPIIRLENIKTLTFEDIRRIFTTYLPDILIIPQALDDRPDRKAVSQAGRIAAALQFNTEVDKPSIFGYLIDYDTYPNPLDLIDIFPLLPPSG